MYLNETIMMNNGIQIPVIQLGTWLMNNQEARTAVQNAIDIGYRAFDTAKDYGNEKGVGKGIWNSDIEREDLFLTTKIPSNIKDYQNTKGAIDEALDTFGLDYIDLMLIHTPQPWIEVNRISDRHYEGNLECWRAMEEAVKDGKVRSIGVSNFVEDDVANILENSSTVPAVNQIEVHIGNTPVNLINYCQEQGITIEAYSPLAHGRLLNNPIIKQYASKYHVTPAQFMLQYDLELGCVVLPKSDNCKEMTENLQLGFEICNEDMMNLQKMNL